MAELLAELRFTLDCIDDSEDKPEGAERPYRQKEEASASVWNVDVAIFRLEPIPYIHGDKQRTGKDHEGPFGVRAKYGADAKRNGERNDGHDDTDVVEDDHESIPIAVSRRCLPIA